MMHYIQQFPELAALLIIVVPVLASYIFLYPSDRQSKAVFIHDKFTHLALLKMSFSSFVTFILALAVIGFLFWDSGTLFSMYFFSVNWFWFSLNVYLLLELIMFIIYRDKIDLEIDVKI